MSSEVKFTIKPVTELKPGDKITGERTVVKVVEQEGFPTQVFHGPTYRDYVHYKHPQAVEVVYE